MELFAQGEVGEGGDRFEGEWEGEAIGWEVGDEESGVEMERGGEVGMVG